MSALADATFLNADACAKACVHTRACPICPLSLVDFLDRNGTICEEGERIHRLIERSKRAIAEAVRQPFREEVAS